MEQFEHAMGMLDLMHNPAFCVQGGIIVKVNPAASAFLIETGTNVQTLLHIGADEYTDFKGGCLYLTLSIAGHKLGASVTRMQEFDVFCIEQEETDAHLQALALAARELRAPLSNVMTVADKLFTADLDDTAREQAAHMNRGFFQMLRILNNMSDANRYAVDNGNQQEVRNISSLMDEIFSRAAVLAEHTNVTLSYTGYPEGVYTLADVQKLERMVFNMLSNAIKYTPAGSSITAKLTRRGSKMYLSLWDSGCGIAENQRSSVFSRYTRELAMEDGRNGLGLGMALIRSIATAHKGTVLVDHPEGCGTRITVSLAIRQGDTTLRSPRLRVDYAGERDHGLIELADVLPAHLYDPDTVN